MSGTAVLWVDSDTRHAAAARKLITQNHPAWRVVHSPTPETALAPLASQAWQAVVLCLDIEFSPYARALPALQPLAAIFDRVLAEHGRYELEPLVHGQRHRIHFTANP